MNITLTTDNENLEEVAAGFLVVVTANVTANFTLDNTIYKWYIDGVLVEGSSSTLDVRIATFGPHTIKCEVTTGYTTNSFVETVSNEISLTIIDSGATDYSDDTQYDGLTFTEK